MDAVILAEVGDFSRFDSPIFSAYLAKKRAEGKRYNVAIPPRSQEVVRLIYALKKYRLAA